MPAMFYDGERTKSGRARVVNRIFVTVVCIGKYLSKFTKSDSPYSETSHVISTAGYARKWFPLPIQLTTANGGSTRVHGNVRF